LIKRVLITGAAGFLGSHAVRHFLMNTDWDVVALVSFRHRGMSPRLYQSMSEGRGRVTVVTHDLIGPIDKVTAHEIGPVDYIINYAAESHVDRSIAEPGPFISNNVTSVLTMLEYARTLEGLKAFVQISTDEVYGPAPEGHAHKEWEAHLPSNPYSASKSAQEAIAFSYWRTYGVPVVITNCMNLIGEMQDPEKFVPMVIKKVLRGEEIPLHARQITFPSSPFDSATKLGWEYGSRFYLHARNMADAVLFLLTEGGAWSPPKFSQGFDRPAKFHIVGEREVDNFEMASMIFDAYMEASPPGVKYFKPKPVDFHSSRPGHDMRYALDGSKLEELGWKRPVSLEEAIKRTVAWYLKNPEWLG